MLKKKEKKIQKKKAKNLRVRKLVIKELLDTEKSYLKQLNIVVKHLKKMKSK